MTREMLRFAQHDKESRAIYLVSGIPGAGKTSVSRLLASRFARGVHIESDLLQEMIVTGGQGVAPDDEPENEGRRQLRLRGRNACLLADSFFEAGFTPVVDDVVVGFRLERFVQDIKNRPLLFVLLAPRLEVVSRRDATRSEKHVFETWSFLDEVMRTETPRIGLWIDSSELTAEETVEVILRDAWKKATVE